jgi:hypothetical protein
METTPNVEAPKRARRWRQFRLRSLLLATTLCAVVLAVVVAPVYQARRSRHHLAALRSHDVELFFDYQFDGKGNLLQDARPPESTLIETWAGKNEFRRLSQIRLCNWGPEVNLVLSRIAPQLAAINHPFDLDFRGSSLSGASLASIADLRAVQSLDLGGTPLDDDELQPLAKMLRLRELILPATTGDKGFEHVAGLLRLRRLARCRPTRSSDSGWPTELQFARVRDGQWLTDAGLPLLKSLTELEALDLSFARVSDAGLSCLAGLTNLKSLDLSHTDITDAGLAKLKSLKRLETLDLSETRTLGDGLLDLAAMPRLRCLDLACCRSPLDFEDVRRRRGDSACEAERRAAVNGAVVLLTDLKHIETLCLNGIDLYDGTCEFLAELPALKVLDLSRTSITNAGVECLQPAPCLRELWLASTAVDDQAIKTLKAFPALKEVYSGGADIDPPKFEGTRVKAVDAFWRDSPREW